MSQTEATKLALERDSYLCQYHRHVLGIPLNVFAPQKGCFYYAGGHHVFGRAIVDTPETIISLCCQCHWDVEHAKISKRDMVALLSQIVGVNLFEKYRRYCKWGDAEWQESLLKTGFAKSSGWLVGQPIWES